MRGVQAVVVVISVVEGVPELFYALELQTGAVKARDANVRSADMRMQARLTGRRSLLWTDKFPNCGRQRLISQSGSETSGDQSLTTTLRQTRDAVNALARPPESPVSCPNRSRNFEVITI